MDDLHWSSADVLAYSIQLASQATLFPNREDTVACFQAIELVLYYAREHGRWPTHADLHSLQHCNPLLLRLACGAAVIWLCSARRHGLAATQLAVLAPHAQRMMDLVAPWDDPFERDAGMQPQPQPLPPNIVDGDNGGAVQSIPAVTARWYQDGRVQSESPVTVRGHSSFVGLTRDDPFSDSLDQVLATPQGLFGGGPGEDAFSSRGFGAADQAPNNDLFDPSNWIRQDTTDSTTADASQQPDDRQTSGLPLLATFAPIPPAEMTTTTTTTTTTKTMSTTSSSSDAFKGLTQYHNNMQRHQSAAMTSFVSQVYPTGANSAATTATQKGEGQDVQNENNNNNNFATSMAATAAEEAANASRGGLWDSSSTWLHDTPRAGDAGGGGEQPTGRFQQQDAFRLFPTLGGF
ncbi:hypothetical protein MN608_07371 [Microdochium nivale]|nr:hypothetical protein MN608_07371 [Microdochium nivale]